MQTGPKHGLSLRRGLRDCVLILALACNGYVLRVAAEEGQGREVAPERVADNAAIDAAIDTAADAAAAAADAATAATAEEFKPATQANAASDCRHDDWFVISSTATMREGPDPAAKALAVLPIGTHASGSCEDGEWRRVWAPGVAGLVGWVRADLLGRAPPSYPELRASFDALPEEALAQRRIYAERMVAIAPTRTDAHEALIALLEKAGDAPALSRARRALTAIRAPAVEMLAEEGRLLLVVDHGFISPVARLEPGGIVSFDHSVANRDVKGQTDDQPGYFRPLRALYHYSRGGDAGLLRVLRREEASCESVMALVEPVGIDPDLEVDPEMMTGLATNFPLPHRVPDPSMEATDRERMQAVAWIEAGLRKQGLRLDQARALIAKAQSETDSVQVHIARTGPGGARMLIGRLHVEAAGEGYAAPAHAPDGIETVREVAAIVIAEESGHGRYTLRHEQVVLSPGGESRSSRAFLDYLDIDGDGRNELLFVGYGYEWWWYEIWTRRGKGWDIAASGGGGGC